MIRESLVTNISNFFRNLTKKISRKKSIFEECQKIDQDFVFDVVSDKKIPNLKQLKYIGKFYSKTEIFITKLSLILAISSTAILVAVLYKDHIKTQPSSGGEYVEATIGAPTYINPLFSQTNDVDQDLCRLVFSSLMKINEQGYLTEDLVKEYSVSEDQKTYTFVLNQNIKWHDGKSLGSDDVVFTLQSIQDKNFKSPLYATFKNVLVTKINDDSFSITLPEPFAPFLSLLTFGILPEHLWNGINPDHAILAELNQKPIGSGPYKVLSFVKDKNGNIKQYTLERYKNYYSDGPFIDKITLKFFSSLDDAFDALKQGNADGIGFLSQNKSYLSSKEIENKSLKEYKFSLPQYTAMFFNSKSNAALEEKNVRQALVLATDKYKIIENTFSGYAYQIDGPILPGMIGYSENIPAILYDPAKAEKILDDAGWKRVYEKKEDDQNSENNNEEKIEMSGSAKLGSEGEDKEYYTREKKGKVLEISLTTIQKEEMMSAAEKIKEQWQKIGVKVRLQIVEPSKIQKDIIKPRAYEILLFGQILGSDPDPYPFWHSSQINDPGLNLAMYSNKEMDKILEDARKISDESQRAEKYTQFQKKLIEDVPAIFLYSVQYAYILPKKINGIETISIKHTSDRFCNIENWFIKTKKRINFD